MAQEAGNQMVKILVYRGKYDTLYYDINTPEKRNEAYENLFAAMKEEGYYDPDDMNPREKEVFLRADAGHTESIIRFLTHRSNIGAEYEDIKEASTEN